MRRGKKADPEEGLRKRRERAFLKEKLVADTVKVPIPDQERCCPHCQRQDFCAVDDGKASTIYDYVPVFFRRRQVQCETLACACGEHIITALSPEKSPDKTRLPPDNNRSEAALCIVALVGRIISSSGTRMLASTSPGSIRWSRPARPTGRIRASI